VQEASDKVDAGKVIRTDPPVGTTIDKGTQVTMVVSSGAPQVAVPEVRNLTESDARNALQAAGFQQSVSYLDVPFDSSQAGKVVTQSPVAGTPSPKGSTVTITVGRAQAPPSTTTTTTTTTTPTTVATTAPRIGGTTTTTT
jgi:serine/threonine-protein kinase